MHQSPRMIETWWDKSWKRLKRRPVSDSRNKSALHQVLYILSNITQSLKPSQPQVTMLKSKFKVGVHVSNGGGPGSVLLSTQRQSLLLRTRNSSSKVPTGWRTREHAGLRTRVGSCMSCSICLALCTPRWDLTGTNTSPSSVRTYRGHTVENTMWVKVEH